MSDLTHVSLTQGQLPELCTRLVGHELSEGQVGFIALSDYGIEHAGVLDAHGGVDGARLLRMCETDVDKIHLIGHGNTGQDLALAWAHSLNETAHAQAQTGQPLVGEVLAVDDGRWHEAGDVAVGGAVQQLGDHAKGLIPAPAQPSPQQVLDRLMPGGPPHDVSILQARKAQAYVKQLDQRQSPVEQVALAEDILVSWEDKTPIEAHLANLIGDEDIGSTALFCQLMERDVVRDAVIATATEKLATVAVLTGAARCSNEHTRTGVTTAAGTAIWLTGTDGHGPVGSAATVRMLDPVASRSELGQQVHAAASTGQDPRPVAAQVRDASEGTLDRAEHAWSLAQARDQPATSVPGAHAGATTSQQGPGPSMR